MTPEDALPALITPVFRGSYVNLIKPRAIEEGSEPKFSMLIVLPKGKKSTRLFIEKLKKRINSAVTAKFGKPVKESNLKHFPIRDGDAGDNEAFHGHWLIPASNKFKPDAISVDEVEMLTASDLYSGAWYRVNVDVFAWSHKTGGKGVSVNLKSVLKVRDDEAFGGGSKAKNDFAQYLAGTDE